MLRGKTELIGGPEIAEYLEISLNTLYPLFRDRHRNGVPIYTLTDGGNYRSTEEDLDAWRERLLRKRSTLNTDLIVNACSREYVVLAREGLLAELADEGADRWGMPEDARASLLSAAERVDEDDQAGALSAAARAVAALEIWGHDLRQEEERREGRQLAIEEGS